MRFAVEYFSISLLYLPWDSKKKQNKINFFTLPLGITALMLSFYYNFHVASSGTDHSQEENREMFFLQMTNICLMLSTGPPCESFTFYQQLPPQLLPLSPKYSSSGDQMANIVW